MTYPIYWQRIYKLLLILIIPSACAGTGLAYDHGDHVAVFASNSDDTVDEASRLLGLDPELVFELNLPDGNPERLSTPLPCPTTLRTALRMHADLLNHPDKHALEALASCAGSKVSLDALIEKHLLNLSTMA